MAISKIILNGVTQMDVTQDTVASTNLLSGYTATKNDGTKVSGAYVPPSAPTLQSKTKTYTPTTSQQTETITADSGYDGLEEVDITVNAIQTETKSATPSETAQTITPSSGKYLSSVSVGAIASDYVGSGITQRSSSDLTASGATVTVPSGYYSAQASKSVASGTEGTPTATKGTVSNHSISVTPSVTNTTGYVTGGTVNGTAVTVSASELVSGTKSITGNGTGIDVTNYASVDVNVSSVPLPFFTATLNDITGVYAVTCDMTYAQCASLLNVGDNPGANLLMIEGEYQSYWGGNSQIWDGGANPIVYTFNTFAGTPSFDIVYYANGTLEWVNTSSTLITLTATQNGTYTPPYGKVYNEVVVNVSGGGSSTISVGKTTRTLASASSSIQFTGLSGNPTSFAVTSSADITTNTNGVTAVVFDGTSLHGQILSTQATADTGFTKSYSGGTLTITATTGTFQANEYKLVYTYGGSTSDIETADIQVGSGATSITFPVTGRPIYWSCIFKSDFSTSSGYQRVIEVVNDGSSTYGMCLDSSAHASSSYWTANYSGGNLVISSQSTNAGGYFHQPGYYQLTYTVDDSAPSYQTKTVTPTTSQQTVTADSGYDALSQVTVNAMPTGVATSATTISGTAATVSTGTNTLTLTKTVSNTPRITTAGYISTGTAGNSSVTLTANVTTKAAATITPGTTNQTIAAGTYLTGTQTIAGDTDLVGGNILSTANIFGVQGTVVVQNYYTGSSAPSSSTGSNGDLYLQS